MRSLLAAASALLLMAVAFYLVSTQRVFAGSATTVASVVLAVAVAAALVLVGVQLRAVK